MKCASAAKEGGNGSLPSLVVSTRARENRLLLFYSDRTSTRAKANARTTRNERSDVLDARCDERESLLFIEFVGFFLVGIGARESLESSLSLSLSLSLSPLFAQLFLSNNARLLEYFSRARTDHEIFFFCTARTDSSRKKKSTRTRTLTAATISSKAVSEDARTFCSCWRLSHFGLAC